MANRGENTSKLHMNCQAITSKASILRLAKDIIIISSGLMISSFGTAIFYAAELGSSPMATFCDGLHLLLGVSYGEANMMANLVLLAALFFLRRSYIKVGTLLCVFTIGPWINLFTPLLASLHVNSWHIAMRIICTVLGTGLMGLGLGLYVAVDRGFGALEGLAKFMCAKRNVSYTRAKVLQDVLLVAGGIALGATWGVGTLIAIFFTGPTIEWSIRRFSAWLMPKRGTSC